MHANIYNLLICQPIIIGGEKTRIKDNDTLFCFNYRSDRMREIASVLGLEDKPADIKTPSNLHITTMSRYNAEFPFAVAFPPQAMTNVLAEWLAKQGCKQCHIAGMCFRRPFRTKAL